MANRRLTDAQIHDLAAKLEGSTNTIDSVLDEHDLTEADMTIEDCLMLDNYVLLCTQCGWWVAADEVADTANDVICIDCDEDNERS